MKKMVFFKLMTLKWLHRNISGCNSYLFTAINQAKLEVLRNWRIRGCGGKWPSASLAWIQVVTTSAYVTFWSWTRCLKAHADPQAWFHYSHSLLKLHNRCVTNTNSTWDNIYLKKVKSVELQILQRTTWWLSKPSAKAEQSLTSSWRAQPVS